MLTSHACSQIGNGDFWQPNLGGTQSRRDADPRARSAPARNMTRLQGRAIVNPTVDDVANWHRSQISSYLLESWNLQGEHRYYHDGKLGEGQYVYITEEGELDQTYNVSIAEIS